MKHGISNEPVVWLPFSAGGMLAAMLVPIHVLILWLLVPLGMVQDPTANLTTLIANPITQVYLFLFVAGSLFHWAHRFRYVLVDLGVTGGRRFVAFLCYGSAVAGSAWAAGVFFG
jgi:fumarate reductase subunit D